MVRFLIFLLAPLVLFSYGCKNQYAEAHLEKGTDEIVLANVEVEEVPAELPPSEYINWIKNTRHGLTASGIQNHITYSALFTPIEFVALQQITPENISKDLFDEVKKSLEGVQYFTLSLMTPSGEDIVSYKTFSEKQKEERYQYYSYQFQHDLKLVDGNDTLQCVMFHHERTFGVIPYTNFLLGFPLTGGLEENVVNNKTLLVNDKNTGVKPVALAITATALNQIPKLIVK